MDLPTFKNLCKLQVKPGFLARNKFPFFLPSHRSGYRETVCHCWKWTRKQVAQTINQTLWKIKTEIIWKVKCGTLQGAAWRAQIYRHNLKTKHPKAQDIHHSAIHLAPGSTGPQRIWSKADFTTSNVTVRAMDRLNAGPTMGTFFALSSLNVCYLRRID